MNNQMSADEEDELDQEHGDIFLDENDVIEEIPLDEEDLPDVDDESVLDIDSEEPDDSIHIFTGHTAYYLNPKYHHTMHLGIGSNPDLLRALEKVISRLENDPVRQSKCMKQVKWFRDQLGSFGRPSAIAALANTAPGEIYTVACSPTDASLVATGGGDDKGFLWKIGRADWGLELQGHKDSVSYLAFSADGLLLASGSFDGHIHVWDTASGSLKCTLEGPGGGIEWLRWHPKGHLVLAGSEDSTVWMWNADKNAYLNMFSGHGSTVTCGDFTPDGKTICTGSDDASLRIWNPKSGENIHVVKGHPYHNDGLTCLAITSDSNVAITGSKDSSVHMVNITTGKVISSLIAHSDSVECIGLSSSYPWVATGSMDQKLIIWDLQHSSPRCVCDHEEGVACLLWLASSKYIATGCVDGKVRIWDSLSGNFLRTFHGHTDAIQSLATSADGEHLISVSLDQTARVFEISEFR